MKSKKNLRKILCLAVFLVICVAVFFMENRIFGYKDMDEWSTDRRMKQYEELQEGTVDVLVVGSSHMMSGVDTPLLWRQYGISSYNYVSRNQTVPFTYLFLKEALKKQHPSLIIFDISILVNPSDYYGLVYDEYHAHVNFDVLPMSVGKVKLLSDYIPVRDQLPYYVPFLRFHSRWKELSAYDFGVEEGAEVAPIYSGFNIVTEVWDKKISYENIPVDLPEKWKKSLNDTLTLCREEGCSVMFLDIPNSQNITWEDSEYSYLNGNEIMDEIGYDETTDARDETHMNVYGSLKFTNYLGKYLKENYDLPDRRTDAGFSEMEEICKEYESDMQERGILK